MKDMMRRLFLIPFLVVQMILAGPFAAIGQVTTFEMRHFTSDPKADGVTDFHGETEWFDTDGRVDALNRYAGYASRFWGDPGLDTPLFTDDDVSRRVAAIKPQPLTSVRRTVRLEEWKAYGYKKGKEADVAERWRKWTAGGAKIAGGCLVLDGAAASPGIEPASWRFRIKASLTDVPDGLQVSLVREGGDRLDIPVGPLKDFEIYGDLAEGVIFLSSKVSSDRI